MKQFQLTYSTGTFSDNIAKQVPGTAFALIAHSNGTSQVKLRTYNPEHTYMMAWMEGIATQMEKLADAVNEVDQAEDTDLSLTIYFWNANIDKIIGKVYGVFNDVKGVSNLNPKLLDLKLRKPNKSYYEYHTAMVRMVNAMIEVNNRCATFKVSFIARSPQGEFGLAQQEAQLMIEEQEIPNEK